MKVEELNNEIRERVLSIMKVKGYTKYEMSKRTGMPHATLYTLLNGKLKWSLDFLSNVSNALNVDISELMFGKSSHALVTQLREKIESMELEIKQLNELKVKLDKVKEIVTK